MDGELKSVLEMHAAWLDRLNDVKTKCVICYVVDCRKRVVDEEAPKISALLQQNTIHREALSAFKNQAMQLEAELTELERYQQECVERQVTLTEKKTALVKTLGQADTASPEFLAIKRAFFMVAYERRLRHVEQVVIVATPKVPCRSDRIGVSRCDRVGLFAAYASVVAPCQSRQNNGSPLR